MRGNVLNGLDTWARSTVSPQIDADILDLDQSIWQLVIQLSKVQPDVARTAFALTSQLVEALATLDHFHPALASGVILSFVPVFSGKDFDRAYTNALSHPVSGLFNERQIDVAYWQALVRAVEKRGAASASVIFGVDANTASRVSELGFTGARSLAHYLEAGWSLRCRSELALKAIQHPADAGSDQMISAEYMMAKLAQSLSLSTATRTK